MFLRPATVSEVQMLQVTLLNLFERKSYYWAFVALHNVFLINNKTNQICMQ